MVKGLRRVHPTEVGPLITVRQKGVKFNEVKRALSEGTRTKLRRVLRGRIDRYRDTRLFAQK